MLIVKNSCYNKTKIINDTSSLTRRFLNQGLRFDFSLGHSVVTKSIPNESTL